MKSIADTAHRITDLKLEEMEKRLSAIYSKTEKTVQKKMADYAKSIDEKSEELLQAYKDAETEDEKRKAKKKHIRFYLYNKKTSIIYNSSDGKYYLWR